MTSPHVLPGLRLTFRILHVADWIWVYRQFIILTMSPPWLNRSTHLLNIYYKLDTNQALDLPVISVPLSSVLASLSILFNFNFCVLIMSMGFSRQKYWSGLPFPSPGDLPDPRDWTRVSCIAGRFCIIWATREAHTNHVLLPNGWPAAPQMQQSLAIPSTWMRSLYLSFHLLMHYSWKATWHTV